MTFTRRQILTAGLALPPAMAIGGLSRAEPSAGALNVVATTGMIADAARRIGGDRVAVRSLMGPGVDPHAYRQTRTDIAALARADLTLWHGLYLEAQMEDFMRQLAKRRRVVAVAEATPKRRLLAHDDYADKFDPHIWMDPDLWLTAVEAIRDALTAARPEGENAFAAAAEAYAKEIGALSIYAKSVLATVPSESRVLVTAHDAFNYFGRAYGFEVVGVQGVSTESEAGLSRIAALVDQLVSRKIRAVFVESSVSDRNMRALIEGAAAKGWKVSVGGELFSDAMGEPGTYEGTYLGMIDHNATVIAAALGGAAPAGGRLGELAAVRAE